MTPQLKTARHRWRLAPVLGAVALAGFAAGTAAAAPQLKEFKTSGTWTAPAGVAAVEVLVVGGGGGGGAGGYWAEGAVTPPFSVPEPQLNWTTYCGGAVSAVFPGFGGSGGGGGGGGEVRLESAFSVVPGQAYAVSVGSGGAKGSHASGIPAGGGPVTDGKYCGVGATAGTAGGDGGESAFGTLTAAGGKGGAAGGNDGTAVQAGGAGGDAGTPGNAGGAGHAQGAAGGGGGSDGPGASPVASGMSIADYQGVAGSGGPGRTVFTRYEVGFGGSGAGWLAKGAAGACTTHTDARYGEACYWENGGGRGNAAGGFFGGARFYPVDGGVGGGGGGGVYQGGAGGYGIVVLRFESTGGASGGGSSSGGSGSGGGSSVKAGAPRVTAAGAITVAVTAPGAGTARLTGAPVSRPKAITCRATRSFAAAGTKGMACVPGAAVQRMRRAGPVRVRLALAFRASGGQAQVVSVGTVTLPRLRVAAIAVTG